MRSSQTSFQHVFHWPDRSTRCQTPAVKHQQQILVFMKKGGRLPPLWRRRWKDLLPLLWHSRLLLLRVRGLKYWRVFSPWLRDEAASYRHLANINRLHVHKTELVYHIILDGLSWKQNLNWRPNIQWSNGKKGEREREKWRNRERKKSLRIKEVAEFAREGPDGSSSPNLNLSIICGGELEGWNSCRQGKRERERGKHLLPTAWH